MFVPAHPVTPSHSFCYTRFFKVVCAGKLPHFRVQKKEKIGFFISAILKKFPFGSKESDFKGGSADTGSRFLTPFLCSNSYDRSLDFIDLFLMTHGLRISGKPPPERLGKHVFPR